MPDRHDIAPVTRAEPSLSAALKVFYSVGALGPSTILMVVSTQLLIYWTDIAGILPVVAGSILFVVKVGDAATDMLIGMLSDRTRSRWGRRRPWMLAGGVCLAMSCLVLFHADLLAHGAVLAGSIAAVVLFFVGLSMAQVPHLAMFTDITCDYHERTSLSAYLFATGLIGPAVGLALAPALIGAFGGGRDGYHGMAATVCLFPLLAAAVSVWGVAGAPDFGAHRPRPETRVNWLLSLLSNRPLLILVAAKIATFFGGASVYAGMAYLTLYVLRMGPSGMVIFGLAVTAGNFAGLVVTARLFSRVAKHRLYGFGLLAAALVTLGFCADGPQISRALFGFHVFLFAAVAATIAIPAQSMIPDVVEWDYLLSGVRREGLISSFISAIHKTSPALGALAIGALLSWGGYLAKAGGAPQPESAIRSIKLGASIIPAIAFGLGAIPLLAFYDLTADKLQQGRTGRGERRRDAASDSAGS